MDYPQISIIIPTLNASNALRLCLQSISQQKYPQDKIELIITDGGSVDDTILIAKKFKALVYKNPLKTAEAGKAVGLTKAKGKYIALIDSDNILPNPNWLTRMIKPLEQDTQLIGSEPWAFTYRPQAGFIERYSALIGANDPYAFFVGLYDRQSQLSCQWTGLKLPTQLKPGYLKITLNPRSPIPTIGANGTIFRADFIKSNRSQYLFDIDVITQNLDRINKPLYFAKVKNSIIHTFCESSISKFIRKQRRRVSDFFYYEQFRRHSWRTRPYDLSNIFFGLYSLSLFLPLFDSIRGFIRKQDLAWFFHPLACFLTAIIYAQYTIAKMLSILKPFDRSQWTQ